MNIANHPDFDLGLDTTFNDEKLELEYLKYATGPRHGSKDSQTSEMVSRLHEENTERSKNQRFVTEDELAYDRLGRLIDCRDFLRLLNKIIPARYRSATKHGLLGLQVWVATERGGEWQFLCGAQGGLVPEYSTMYFNSYGVPTSEKYRGWRTVLMRLILGGFASEEKVEKVFGPASGQEASRYRQMMHAYRNR